MAIYVCSNCNKTFNRKANYQRHLNRANPCKKHNYIGNINNENYTVSEEDLKGHESKLKKKKRVKNNTIGHFKCHKCNTQFKKKRYLTIHLKKYCKKNVSNLNNIYTFDRSTFGRVKYGKDGGDIFIIQTELNFDNTFNIGRTTKIYNKLNDYRCDTVIEPRLYYYYPFKNIKKAEHKLKDILIKYNLGKGLYNCDIEIIRTVILKLQQKLDTCQIECEPSIKHTKLSNCLHCLKTFNNKTDMFKHIKDCNNYKVFFIKNGNNKQIDSNDNSESYSDSSSDQDDFSIFSDSSGMRHSESDMKVSESDMKVSESDMKVSENDMKVLENDMKVIFSNTKVTQNHCIGNTKVTQNHCIGNTKVTQNNCISNTKVTRNIGNDKIKKSQKKKIEILNKKIHFFVNFVKKNLIIVIVYIVIKNIIVIVKIMKIYKIKLKN